MAITAIHRRLKGISGNSTVSTSNERHSHPLYAGVLWAHGGHEYKLKSSRNDGMASAHHLHPRPRGATPTAASSTWPHATASATNTVDQSYAASNAWPVYTGDVDPHAPVLDPRLSAADRAVLALAKAASSLSDREKVDRTAAALGLVLVTSSDTCVGPLLPPFGSTLDEDGQEGDGMAAVAAPGKGGKVAHSSLLHRVMSAASAASHTAAAIMPGPTHATGVRARSPGSSSSNNTATAGVGAMGLGALQQAASAGLGQLMTRAGMPPPAVAHSSANGNGNGKTAAEGLVRSAMAEGGGDTTDDEAITTPLAGGPQGMSAMVVPSMASQGQVAGRSGSPGGLVGAAAAALSQVAKAASGAADGRSGPLTVQLAQAAMASATKGLQPHYGDPSSPWLVADDPLARVRYCVVAPPQDWGAAGRGLTADLTTFETYDLGLKVNRQLYTEATALYARFMPLVMDYLESVPGGQICFGGHGVGGSLATLLQLMCVSRGLRYSMLLPAVAVDAPAVLGQVPHSQRRMWGAAGGAADNPVVHKAQQQQKQQLANEEDDADAWEELMARSVLEQLGMPDDAVRNIVIDTTYHTGSDQQQLLLQGAAQGSLGLGLGLGRLLQQQQQHASVDDGDGVAAAWLGARQVARLGWSGGKGQESQQVFKMVGQVVVVEGPGAAASSKRAAGSRVGFGVSREPSELVGGSVGRSGSPGMQGQGQGNRAGGKLSAGMVGNIAAAAATAAAAAAVERLGLGAKLGAGGQKGSAAAVKGTGGAVAAAASVAGTAGLSGSVSPVVTEADVVQLGGDEDDASTWGV